MVFLWAMATPSPLNTGEERLYGLALMQCHRDEVLRMPLDVLLDYLAMKHPRRMAPIHMFEDKE